MEKFDYSICGALNCNAVLPASKPVLKLETKPVSTKSVHDDAERSKPWSAFGEWYWI